MTEHAKYDPALRPIVATLCYLKDDGKTLFLFRNSGNADIHQGKYAPPGGKIEPGERGIDNIVREFLAETGFTILDPKFRGIITYFNKGRIMGGVENPLDWSVEIYEATKFTGKLRPEPGKNAMPTWIEDSKIPGLPKHEGDGELLKFLAKEKKGVWQIIAQYNGEKLILFDPILVYN